MKKQPWKNTSFRHPSSILSKNYMCNLPEAAMQDILARLQDFGEQRLAAMDAADIEQAFLSLTSPGVQIEPDTARTVRLARETNDFLAGKIQSHPTRFSQSIIPSKSRK